MTLLEKLRADHVNLKRLLNLLDKDLDSLFTGNDSNLDLKIELLDYIQEYANKVHQPTEELVFDSLREELKSHLGLRERLGREHEKLVEMACRFRDTLEGIMQGEVISREEVGTRGREFVALQRQHIDLEDNEIFPLFEKVLDPSEWEALADQAPDVEDPVFSRQDYNRFRSLIDYLQDNA